MKKLYSVWIALLCLIGLVTQARAQQCDPKFSVSNVVFANGVAANISSTDYRLGATVGLAAVDTSKRPAVGSTVMGFWSFMKLEPQPPYVLASHGDEVNQVNVSWEIVRDPIGPPVTGQSVDLYRNNTFLATLPATQTAFQDFNVIPGRVYKYEVVSSNRYGSSKKQGDIGFVNPNGVITGHVETRNGNPVEAVEVRLTPNIGYSLKFSGGQMVAMADSAVDKLDEGTIECWVLLNRQTDEIIFSKQHDAGQVSAVLSVGTYADASGAPQQGVPGILYFHGHNGVTAAASTDTIPRFQWVHLAVAFSKTQARIYINGVLNSVTNGDFSIPHDTKADNPGLIRPMIGAWQAFGKYFDGFIDDFRVWAYARPFLDLQKNMNRTIRGDEDSVVAYWKFDEGTGANVYDLSPNHSTAAVCGAQFNAITAPVYTSAFTDVKGNYIMKGVSYGPGTTFAATPSKLTIIGRSLSFDGVDDYAKVPVGAIGNLSTATLEAWVFLRDSVYAPIIAKRQNDIDSNYNVLSVINGRFNYLSRTGGNSITSTGTVSKNKWHHVAVVLTPGGATMYVDGDYNNFAGGDFSMPDNRNPLSVASIGAVIGTSSKYINGKIDEVRVWNTARTIQEIQANYTKALIGSESGLVAYWKFNEASGSLISDATTSGFSGTIQNADSTIWSDDIPINETFKHEFQPEARNVTLSVNSPSVDRVDFNDISTLGVTGFVAYQGTSCFVDSVQVLVDGKTVIPPVYTDLNGKFLVEFEPGSSHTITFDKKGHAFLPSFWDILSISAPKVLPTVFLDTKTNDLQGKVAGGTCEFSLGRTKLHITSTSGCIDTLVFTDSLSGSFSVPHLPPLNYIVGVVSINSNPSTPFPDAKQVSLKDSNNTVKFIYRAPPTAEIVGLPKNACNQLVLTQFKKYPIKIKVYEQYGSNVCLLDTGTVTINDAITQVTGTVPFKNGFAYDTVRPVAPNIISPFTKTLEVVAKDTLGAGREATASVDAIVTGNRPRTQAFTTVQPLQPIYILRDPPGDASSLSLIKDSTYSTTTSSTTLHSHGFEASLDVQFGVETQVITGLGVAVSLEAGFKNTISAGLTFNYNFNDTKSATTSITSSQTFSTSSSDSYVGGDGDVYIGAAVNQIYGIIDVLGMDTTTCPYSPVLSKSLYINPRGVATTYIYSESYLKNTILPQLDSLAANVTLSDSAQTDSARRFYAAQKSAWEQWITLNATYKSNATFKQNISWDAGAVVDNSTTSQIDNTWNLEEDWNLTGRLGGEFGFDVNKAGLTLKLAQSNGGGATDFNETTKSSATTFAYHLEDDDAGDFHVVDIYEDRFGPVFKLLGGATSCPWEPNTQKRQDVQISVSPTSAINVPPDEPAVFSLNLGNMSETDEDGTYQVTVVNASNPNGAVIAINGIVVENGILVDIPHGQQVTVTMTVTRGPLEYEYDGLQVLLSSPCDGQIAAAATFNVHYEVPCSKVVMVAPTNNWTVTSSDPDSLYFTLNGYDRLNPDFQEVRFQYRATSSANAEMTASGKPKLILKPGEYSSVLGPIRDRKSKHRMFNLIGREVMDYRTEHPVLPPWVMDNPWITAITIGKANLPSAQNFVTIPWNVSPDLVPDGHYEIRAITTCAAQTIVGSTAILRGIIDRTPPTVLGLPSPVGGMLTLNDQISITFNEPINCSAFNSPSVVKLVNTVNGQEIDKTLSCDGRTLFITPNIQNKFIENQTLRVSLIDDHSSPIYGVMDQYGNRISKPIEWEFFVQRGPIHWNDARASVVKDEGSSTSFVRTLVNAGGSTASFNIAGLPSWLSVTPSSGIIPAGLNQQLTFTVNQQLPGGVYKDTVTAQTVNGDEMLMLDIRVLCPSPGWVVNASSYQYTMNLDGRVTIEDLPATDGYDMVGAFVGNELRGVASIVEVPTAADSIKYQVFLTVHSNVPSGESFTLKVWDALTCRQLGVGVDTFTFKADTLLGRPDRPLLLAASTQIVQQLPLSAGWTWFSLNLQSPDMGVGSIFSAVNPGGNDIVKSQTSFSQFASGIGWVGSLSSLNTQSMYQVRLAAADTLIVTGYKVNLFASKIPIVRGWNWISYQPQSAYTINYALSQLHPINGDIIKNQSSYAIYVASMGWVGSLTVLSPKGGYLYRSAGTDTLLYPPPPALIAPSQPDPQSAPPKQTQSFAVKGWSVDPAQYQYTMTVTGTVKQNDAVIADSSDLVAAFVNGECRGVARAIPVAGTHGYLFFMVVYGNQAEGEQVEFRYGDAKTAKTYGLAAHLPFAPNGVEGGVLEPFAWTVTEQVDASGHSLIPKAYSLSQNYPNPFNPATVINYALPFDSYVRLAVYDITGRLVKTLVGGQQSAGYHAVTWNSVNDDGQQLPSGVYFYRMNAADQSKGSGRVFTDVKKLLLVK